MPGAIRSSKRLISLKKREEIHKKTREAKAMLELRETPLRTLLSPEGSANDPDFPALCSNVMSVTAVDVFRRPMFRSRSHAIIIIIYITLRCT